MIAEMCIRDRVLSEQMTFIAPIVSQAAIFLTRALCFDILIMFIASETATMVGSPSGTAATISTMLVMNASETVSSEAVPLAMKEASWSRKTAAAAPDASSAISVSYTHLDVYKRQGQGVAMVIRIIK